MRRSGKVISVSYSVIVQWREIDTQPVRLLFSSPPSGAASIFSNPPMLTICRPSLSTPHTVSACHATSLTTVSHSILRGDDALTSVQPEMRRLNKKTAIRIFILIPCYGLERGGGVRLSGASAFCFSSFNPM